MEYIVDCNAKESGKGSLEYPFKTIGEAAMVALPGDVVLVKPGVYREDVSPSNAGLTQKPITYRSIEKNGAVITGAEVIKGWERYKDTVWCVRLKSEFFGDYNPYTTLISGDWLNIKEIKHTGEVYLNDKALYEVTNLDSVLNPVISNKSWNRDFSIYTWFATLDAKNDETVIYANFHDYNPDDENVEINVRRHCFWPKEEHIDYIVLDGFKVTKAATQWAPPTALQEGMIGPHWSKGWIIENCEISHSRCSGISLGKYFQPGNDNKWSMYKYKDGAQTQRDCTFIAQLDGWSKETIGSHTVRNCDIHDCGQTGIVGNLGAVFSVIENNTIHHINNKRDIAGAEVAGVKLHAAIDVIIRNNRIYNNTRGIWLDWQAQGTRISCNLFYDNCAKYDYLLTKEGASGLGIGEDLWLEVSHGPTLVDNNIFLSERAVRLAANGVAFVHNLFNGSLTGVGRGVKNGTSVYDSTRYTPIHKPHSTSVTGIMSILHGDVRVYNNIFVGREIRPGMYKFVEESVNDEWDDFNLMCGTVPFNGYMTEKTWKEHFAGYCGEGSEETRDKYYMPLPVWTGGNAFFNGAKPCDIEDDYMFNDSFDAEIIKDFSEATPKIGCNFIDLLPKVELIDSDLLGEAFEPEERFETPEGEDIVFDIDFYGQKRSGKIIPGPFCAE